ncbi:type I-B CRISPR-associated endonuclease Cas1b [Bernardetia sp. Wsw4-3y2]|uniref:type I-B CRISPR-associated endonuclease Cas1b n=1 Tax=Bernardetia sp. Wsw4-3y2 TaxID=3127471 RepID=UPI0030CDC82A
MREEKYIMSSGRLLRIDNSLRFIRIDEEGNETGKKDFPIHSLSNLYIFSNNMEANNNLYMFLNKHGVGVHFFDYYQNYAGSFVPKEQLLSGKARIVQAKTFIDEKKRLYLAQQFVIGAIQNMRIVLKYYQTRKEDFDKSIIEKLELYLEKVPKATDISMLMGLEGNARIIYYSAFDSILSTFKFEKRSKRPPHNEVNALISFGNTMLYTACMNAIFQTTLDSTISFLHSPGARRYSLALDLAEVFKPFIVDRLIFSLVNTKQIQSKHFKKQDNVCHLNEKGRDVFVKEFQKFMKTTFKHRGLNRHVSKRHLLVLECHKLTNYMMGMQSDYRPFKARW